MGQRPQVKGGESPLFSCERAVLFQDVDAAGIVFFARVFDYCHDAFFALLGERGISMPKVIADRHWGAPLVHAEADYELPLRFGDCLRIEIASIALGKGSMSVSSRITLASGETACSVKTVHAFIDVGTLRPCSVPGEVLAALKDCATVAASA